MNTNRLVTLLAALSLTFLPGCYVYSDDYDTPGDVTFSWSFYGYSCAQEPEIQTVHIIIFGESLENGGYYPCRVSGYDGITLRNFAPGRYEFDIEAIDYSGYVSYYGGGSFTVDGNVHVDIDLDPT